MYYVHARHIHPPQPTQTHPLDKYLWKENFVMCMFSAQVMKIWQTLYNKPTFCVKWVTGDHGQILQLWVWEKCQGMVRTGLKECGRRKTLKLIY